jgi:HK97 gp10 family phage protein
MQTSVTVTGVEEIKRAFRELPRNIARKVIRQAERKAMRIPLAAARANAPVKTGKGRKSLRIRASKGPRGAGRDTIAIALLVGAAVPGETWYMQLQEKGWQTGKRVRSGGKVVGRVGTSRKIPGKRFMKNALTTTEEQVKAEMIDEITAGIEREASV